MIERGAEPVDSRTESWLLARPLEASAPVHCLNCGSVMSGRFCAACGQSTTDPDPTLREYLHEIAAEFLLWDGKLAATFRSLVAKPGELTREFLAGRRVRYISPLRLYLTCSVVYFFLRALAPEPPLVVVTGSVTNTQIGGVVVQEQSRGATLAMSDRLARSTSPVKREIGRHVGRSLRHLPEFRAAMRENTPRMMFVLVPFFAALLSLIYRKRRMHYPQHLTFALHTHAFLFLALIPTLVPRIVKGQAYGVPLSAIAVAGSFVSIIVYFIVAMRRIYGGSVAGTIARGTLLAATYFVAFTIALLLTVAIVMVVHF